MSQGEPHPTLLGFLGGRELIAIEKEVPGRVYNTKLQSGVSPPTSFQALKPSDTCKVEDLAIREITLADDGILCATETKNVWGLDFSEREDELFSVTVPVTSHPNRTRRIQAPAAYPGLPGRRGKRKGRGRGRGRASASWSHPSTRLLVLSGHLQVGAGSRGRVWLGEGEDVGGALTRCPSNWSCVRK